MFSCEYCEIFNNSFFSRTTMVAASSAAPENGVLKSRDKIFEKKRKGIQFLLNLQERRLQLF